MEDSEVLTQGVAPGPGKENEQRERWVEGVLERDAHMHKKCVGEVPSREWQHLSPVLHRSCGVTPGVNRLLERLELSDVWSRACAVEGIEEIGPPVAIAEHGGRRIEQVRGC